MTDLLVCDMQPEDMNVLREDCFRYCFKKNYDVQVYGYSNMEQAEDYIGKCDVRMTYLLSCDDVVDALIGNIRSQNAGNYVVLVASSLKELMVHTNPVVRPVGCLMKPVKQSDVAGIIESIREAELQGLETEETLTFKIHSREYYLDCSQIIMIEAVSKKLVVYTAVQEYEFYDTLNRIAEQLPEYFARCHKSYIINMNKIREIDYSSMEIHLEDGLDAYLSRSLKAEFAARLAEKRGR